MMYFLTFSNLGYMNTDRIANQAKEFQLFDNIIQLNENDIPEYIEKHKRFIINNKPGYGRWIWKPKIIHDTLLQMKENDILFYADAGTYLNIHGKKRFLEYIELLQKNDNSLITFSTNGYYAKQYVKSDAVLHYYKDKCNDFFEDNSTACYAGIMLIKKNNKSLSLIRDWLEMCENYHFLDQSASYNPENSCFIGTDFDNGLFNLCLIKNKIHHSIYPDETNIYVNNKQIHHTTNNIPITTWNELHDKPIQVRRITPKYLNEYNKYNKT
jgi:hypothetical protein